MTLEERSADQLMIEKKIYSCAKFKLKTYSTSDPQTTEGIYMDDSKDK